MRAHQPPLPGLPVSGSHAGALQQQTGADAERAVEAAHRACVVAGLASPLLRLDAGIRMGPGGRAVVRARGSVDYTATLRGGRALLVEVKACDDRLRMRQLGDHQAEALTRADHQGALCLVMAVTPTALYALPWDWSSRCPCPLWARWHAWHQRNSTVASMAVTEMAPWAVRPGQMYLQRRMEER